MKAKRCDRCGRKQYGFITSSLNTQSICDVCKEDEKSHPLYDKAIQMDNTFVSQGKFDFKGICDNYSPELNYKWYRKAWGRIRKVFARFKKSV